jgi:hypothetical protein
VSAELAALLVSIAGFVAVTAIGIIGYFLKRTVDSNDTRIKALEDSQTEDLKEFQKKIDRIRSDFEGKIERFQERIGAKFDKATEDYSRTRSASYHDIDSGDEKLRQDLSNFRDRIESKISSLEREFLEFKGNMKASFVSREDFIRESTLLETRIVATRRTLEGLDEVLKGYVER